MDKDVSTIQSICPVRSQPVVCEALICKLVYLFIVFGEHGRYIGNINHLWWWASFSPTGFVYVRVGPRYKWWQRWDDVNCRTGLALLTGFPKPSFGTKFLGGESNVTFVSVNMQISYLFIVFGEHGRYIGNINHQINHLWWLASFPPTGFVCVRVGPRYTKFGMKILWKRGTHQNFNQVKQHSHWGVFSPSRRWFFSENRQHFLFQRDDATI